MQKAPDSESWDSITQSLNADGDEEEAGGGGRPQVLLYIHGGAFVFCTPSTQRMMLAELVKRTGLVVLAVDYPRPPEHPFPQPHTACETVYDWLTTTVQVRHQHSTLSDERLLYSTRNPPVQPWS